MTSVSVVVVFGLPASGKTSLCRSLVTHGLQATSLVTDGLHGQRQNIVPSLDTLNVKFIHICYDSILPHDQQKLVAEKGSHLISNELSTTTASPGTGQNLLAVPSDFNNEELRLWKHARIEIQNNVNELIKLLKSNSINFDELVELLERHKFKSNITKCSRTDSYVLLVDDNFFYRSMRYAYYCMAANHQVFFSEIYLHSDLATSLRFNARRKTSGQSASYVPTHVIEIMFDKMEPPHPSKYKWEQFHLTLAMRHIPPIPRSSQTGKNDPTDTDSEQTQEAGKRTSHKFSDVTNNTVLNAFTASPANVRSVEISSVHQKILNLYPVENLDATGIFSKTKYLSQDTGLYSESIPFCHIAGCNCDGDCLLPASTLAAVARLLLGSSASFLHERRLALERERHALAGAAVSRAVCSKSVLHKADLALRQLVSASVDGKRATCATAVSKHAKAANQARQSLLKQVKEGFIVLPTAEQNEYGSELDGRIKSLLYERYITEMRNLTGEDETLIITQ